MPDAITFNVANKDGNVVRKYTCLTENKSYINSIITVNDGNVINESDVDILNTVAKRSGDAGIVEQSDLNGNEKRNLALNNNFGKYYDISVSDDGKYLRVKIKDAGLLCKNPNLADIKSDFGLKDGVLVQKRNIPHGNSNVIPSSTYGGGFDSVTISVGKTINIPVSEINISGSPRGALGRIISFLNN